MPCKPWIWTARKRGQGQHGKWKKFLENGGLDAGFGKLTEMDLEGFFFCTKSRNKPNRQRYGKSSC
jgi:hypothetical protein